METVKTVKTEAVFLPLRTLTPMKICAYRKLRRDVHAAIAIIARSTALLQEATIAFRQRTMMCSQAGQFTEAAMEVTMAVVYVQRLCVFTSCARVHVTILLQPLFENLQREHTNQRAPCACEPDL
jgi:hypothetical protein